MAAASDLRIGDADREAAAGALREHFAHGRLTLEEFQHRLELVFAAKTDRDLAAITRDLPHVAPAPAWPDGRSLTAGPPSRSSSDVQVIKAGFAGLLTSSLIRPVPASAPPSAGSPSACSAAPSPAGAAAAPAPCPAVPEAAAVRPSSRKTGL